MVLSFGELLVRLSPGTAMDWLNKEQVNIYIGGSEMNTIAALAKWRMPACFCTALADNFLSSAIVKKIAEQNIDTSAIVHYGTKTGLYYLQGENTLKDDTVIYDRLHSSFYDLKPGVINWDTVFNGIRWFHFNALSAGLNHNTAAVCKEALEACARKSITVSMYMHQQPQLWLNKNKPNKVIPDLLQHCDVLIADLPSIEASLGIEMPINKRVSKDDAIQLSKNTCEAINKQFARCKIIANSFYAYDNAAELFGTVCTNNNVYVSASYKSNEITDKSGSADSFTAGLIYGIYNHLPFQQVINFAAGAGFQKLFVKGERMDKTAEEVKSFILHFQHQ